MKNQKNIHSMATIKDRLTQIAKYNGLSIRGMEATCNLGRGNISNMSDTSNIGSDKLSKIVDMFPMIDLTWLLTGKGEMFKAEQETSSPADTYKPAMPPKGIPLIPMEAIAGFPAIDNEGMNFSNCEHYYIPEFESKGADFLIRVSGDSMKPIYNSGDVIACRKIQDIVFFQWGNIYVMDTSQGVLVKYIEECEKSDDFIMCRSENRDFKPFALPKSDIRSLSTIIGMIRIV